MRKEGLWIGYHDSALSSWKKPVETRHGLCCAKADRSDKRDFRRNSPVLPAAPRDFAVPAVSDVWEAAYSACPHANPSEIMAELAGAVPFEFECNLCWSLRNSAFRGTDLAVLLEHRLDSTMLSGVVQQVVLLGRVGPEIVEA
jgi:hypothetical protein